MAATDEFVHRVRADKTGAARNHVTHSRSPPSSCRRPAAGKPTRGRLLPAAAVNAGPAKTPGPRFATLIVRARPANAAGRFPRTETILYDGSGRTKASFKGASQKRNEPPDHTGYRCNCGFGLRRRSLLLAARTREPSRTRSGVGRAARIS